MTRDEAAQIYATRLLAAGWTRRLKTRWRRADGERAGAIETLVFLSTLEPMLPGHYDLIAGHERILGLIARAADTLQSPQA